MLLVQELNSHIGKTIASITTNRPDSRGIHMVEKVVIHFTDGTSVLLRTDWRGAECYISQYVHDGT